MKQFLIIIGLFSMLACSNPSPSISPTKIQFDGETFELPIKVETAQKVLRIRYMAFFGFLKHEKAEDPFLLAQLEGRPMIQGDDDETEQSYSDQSFVGISFLQNADSYSTKEAELEKQYGKKFIKKVGYSYFETEDGLIIAIKHNVMASTPKKYISISFYKGISSNELEDYLSYVMY